MTFGEGEDEQMVRIGTQNSEELNVITNKKGGTRDSQVHNERSSKYIVNKTGI